MVFKCQEDSFLREFTSKVVLCEPADYTPADSGQKITGYNVILEDTILFPEGGGQPCDYGLINGHKVLNVIRKGRDAIHFVAAPETFIIGDDCRQTVDWSRRFDHMQQHSGQHLLSATLEREYNISTKSWWLGSDTSYVELDCKDLTTTHVENIERILNQLIRDARVVSVVAFDVQDIDNLSDEVTRATKGLPKDHTGPVRVVTIDGIDSNMCCGTHVSNLSQLQVIKLLNVEKTKGKLMLHFLVGNRVLDKLKKCYDREVQLNLLLNGGPDSHIDLINKYRTSIKSNQRILQRLLKEIATDEAMRLKNLIDHPKYFCLHRMDGVEPDFISTFLRMAPSDKGIFYFLTVGDEVTGKGQMMLYGNQEHVERFGNEFCAILDGKGNGKGSKFQAKINNLKGITECNQLISNFFSN